MDKKLEKQLAKIEAMKAETRKQLAKIKQLDADNAKVLKATEELKALRTELTKTKYGPAIKKVQKAAGFVKKAAGATQGFVKDHVRTDQELKDQSLSLEPSAEFRNFGSPKTPKKSSVSKGF